MSPNPPDLPRRGRSTARHLEGLITEPFSDTGGAPPGPRRDGGERRHRFLILSLTGEELVVFTPAATGDITLMIANRSHRRLAAQRSHKLGPVITVGVIAASPDVQSSYSTAALSSGTGFHGDLVEDSQEFTSGLGKLPAQPVAPSSYRTRNLSAPGSLPWQLLIHLDATKLLSQCPFRKDGANTAKTPVKPRKLQERTTRRLRLERSPPGEVMSEKKKKKKNLSSAK